jgi:hypothetical protein
MLGLKNIARIATLSLFGLGATALLSSHANAQTPTFGTKNSIFARSGGTNWTYSLIDNFDTTGDGVPESKFTYYITRRVTYEGDIRKRTYNMAAGTIRIEGNITQTGLLKYWATYAPGGMYGQGVSGFVIYQDTNFNGIHNAGEPVILDGSRGCALTGIMVSYASTFDLNQSGSVTDEDLQVFESMRKTQPSIADFNGDRKVDDSDYVLLTSRLQ